MQATGANAVLVGDTETSFKSDPSSIDGKVIPFVTSSLASAQNLIDSETITNSRNPAAPAGGNIDLVGDIVTEFSETAYSWLLKHALGSVVTTGSADPWTHVFKIAQLPVSLLIATGFTDIGFYVKSNGVRVNRVKWEFPTEGIVRQTFSMLGAVESFGSTPYDATPTVFAFQPYTTFSAAIEEGGGSIGIVKSCEITLDNDLDPDSFVIGGLGFRRSIPEGRTKVTGQIVVTFEDLVMYSKAVGLTESSLKITLTRGGSPARSAEFFIPELIYERHSPPVEGPRGVTVTLPFRGYFGNSAQGTALQITLQNGLSAV